MRDVEFMLVGEAGEKLSTMAYKALRELIVYGELEPGERLYPIEIAERFGISVTPVKEAFTRLHAEGYLEAVPRRGYTVTVPTPKRITELWQVRCGLEITAGELIIDRIKSGSLRADGLAVLDESLASLEAKGSQSHREHIELNADFHLQLVKLSGNEELLGLYVSIAQHTIGAWVQTGLGGWKERLVGEAAEHAAIMQALRKGNPDEFRLAMKTHLGRSLDDAIEDVSLRTLEVKGGRRRSPITAR